MANHEVQSSGTPTCDAIDQQVTSQPYIYDDILTQPEKTIRLLTVHPGVTETVECSLHLAKLSTELRFKALSYAWGTRPATKSIAINGKSLHVRPSLWALLKRLQKWDEETVIWIDAICVDQSNIAERNQQVRLMSSVYSFADVVLVWLGRDYDGVLSVLGTVYDHKKSYLKEVFAKGRHKSWRRKEGRRQHDEAIEYLAHSPYWSRAWVAQEYGLARDALLLYGEEGQMSRKDWDRCYHGEPNVTHQGRVNAFTFYPDRHSHHGSDQHLHKIVARYRKRECSDPRDHLYAFLGMAADRDVLDIDADYSITMEKLCLKVEAAYSSAQAVAYYAQYQQPPSTAPSWDGTLSSTSSDKGHWSERGGTDSQSGVESEYDTNSSSETDDLSYSRSSSDLTNCSRISLPQPAYKRYTHYITRCLRTAGARQTFHKRCTHYIVRRLNTAAARQPDLHLLPFDTHFVRIGQVSGIKPPIALLRPMEEVKTSDTASASDTESGWVTDSGSDADSAWVTNSASDVDSKSDTHSSSDADDPSDACSLSDADGSNVSLSKTAHKRCAHYIMRRLRTAAARQTSHTDLASDADSAWVNDSASDEEPQRTYHNTPRVRLFYRAGMRYRQYQRSKLAAFASARLASSRPASGKLADKKNLPDS